MKYYGTDDTEHTLDVGEYQVDTVSYKGRVGLAYGKTWPATTLRPMNGIMVEFTAGYGDATTDVPVRIRQAIKVLAAHMYENREATNIRELSEVPFAVHALLGFQRILPI